MPRRLAKYTLFTITRIRSVDRQMQNITTNKFTSPQKKKIDAYANQWLKKYHSGMKTKTCNFLSNINSKFDGHLERKWSPYIGYAGM